MIIDVHAHCLTSKYRSVLAQYGAAPPPLMGMSLGDTEEELASRLQMMDRAGVHAQVLSHGPFHPYRLDESEAIHAARVMNEEVAQLVRASAGRLRGFVALPLPHIDAALTELRHGLDGLGMAGVTVNTSVNDVSIADERFEPLFAELDRRAAVLFIHPSAANCLCSPLIRDYKLNAIAPPLEDSVVALQLIVRQIPIRFPKVRIVIAHLGGALPLFVERIDNQLPSSHPGLAEAPSASLRRFWFDTVAHGSTRALHAACEVYDADRLVLGSDFPFQNRHGGYEKTLDYIRGSGLAPADIGRILEENAQALFSGRL